MPGRISVVIVNYNVRHFVARCIDSVIQCNSSGLEVDIYVVDNASIDGSVQMLKNSYPDVHLIANSENVGFSKANNQALRLVKSEYVLILNPDTVIQEDTLHVCYTYMENNLNVGALGVKMIDGAGKFLPESKRALPTAWNSLSKLIGLSSLFPKSKLFNGYALGHLSPDEDHVIDVLCGAFMFIRKTAMDKVGMFDERFFMYGEDIDWSKRIQEGGFEIHYTAKTTIIHYKGESTKKGSLNYVKTFYNAMHLYVEKHYDGMGGQWFGRLLRLGIQVRGVLSALRRIITQMIAPVLDATIVFIGIRLFSGMWAKYYFKNEGYYSDSYLNESIIAYSLIWSFVLWFVGYYKKATWRKRIVGVASGLLIILSGYSLLTESYRTSRVILLAGGGIALLVTWLSSKISSLFNRKEKSKNILIVADKKVADKIQQNLKSAKVKGKVLGYVSPHLEDDKNLDYLNTVEDLSALSKVLKANEIIFSTECMTMQDIMKQMMHLDTSMEFKIAGDDSLSILGSSSKNKSGELYTLNIKYKLEDDYAQHTKRSFDFGVGILLLLLFPVLVVFNRFQLFSYLRRCIEVIVGIKTWVGYSGDKSFYQNLPEVKPGVINCTKEKENITDKRQVNMYYARDYSVWQDLEILLSKINKLV